MTTRRLLALMAPLVAAAACGSRTGLLLPLEIAEEGGVDAGEDAPADAEADVTVPFDAREELPGIDVIVPQDAFNDCPDAGSTYIYLITSQSVLMAFYPPTNTFHTVGTIRCPVANEAPFSMAVDRAGVAYVVFGSTLPNGGPPGHVFRVSTLTAACQATGYVPGAAPGFPEFGMGFSKDVADPSETLYVTGDPGFNTGVSEPAILGSLDTTSFKISPIGTIQPTLLGPELTGTASGQLFAFFANGATSSAIAEIDRKTAHVLSVSNLPGVAQGGGWAFGFWGGAFYTFTAPGGPMTSSVVTRFSPSDGSVTQVAATPGLTIVGAGVSTCAPQQ